MYCVFFLSSVVTLETGAALDGALLASGTLDTIELLPLTGPSCERAAVDDVVRAGLLAASETTKI